MGRYTLPFRISTKHENPDGKSHEDAPSASISKSTDHGATWTWNTQEPMFSNYQFTTIFFLDFGKNNANAIDGYVYAYGLDNNWHMSDGTVPNPVDVYLARVTPDHVQNRSSWQFYAGTTSSGLPQWTSNIDERAAVLHDEHRTRPKPTKAVTGRKIV